jgi:hypothetical protein
LYEKKGLYEYQEPIYHDNQTPKQLFDGANGIKP